MDHIWVTPLPQLGLWTFEPAFSPRFSFPLSPRSFFHTRQRFPNSNHVTSGCMSPRSTFDQWSAVSHTGNDMTSSSDHVIALHQSGASICPKRAHCTTKKQEMSCVTVAIIRAQYRCYIFSKLFATIIWNSSKKRTARLIGE